jgi:hypothetical protein
MNPYKLREIYKYLTRAKKTQPDLPDVFSASKAPIPPKTQNVKEMEAINRFVLANPRIEKAGGGMLVQPSDDGSRPKYGGPGSGTIKPKVQLTKDMIESMAAQDEGMRAADILAELKKDKTKKYITATGSDINRSMIQRVLTGAGDRNLQIQDKIPEGYITSTELFEKLPISKKDYYRNVYKPGYAGQKGTLFTRKIDELLQPIKIPGVQTQYFKNPTNEQLKLFEKYSSRKGILQERTAKLMKNFHDAFSNKYAKGELPTIKEINELFPDVTPTTAGNVTAKLGQWYKGTEFLNPELESINLNKDLGKKIQKAMSVSRFGRFYPDQAYLTALNTIDETIGREAGTFKSFKDAASKALKEAGLPIYSKKSPFGFNLNEMAGITGASRTKTAAFSDFVDIAEGSFNQKQLGEFQKKFAAIREQLDSLDLANKPQNRKQAQSLIEGFKDTIKYYENATGSELPKLGLGTADNYYSTERLKDIAKKRSIGEKRSRNQMFKEIPGTDLLGSSKSSGYTVVVPENYRTFGQILETGKRGELKKNVQNTLDGMKKFFNEYDEKKMFQKLKNATPDTLKKMMKVIPKFVSLEDDIKRYASANNIMSDATYVDDVEEKFTKKNPLTTQALGSIAVGGAALAQKPFRTGLGKAFRTLGTRAAAVPFAGLTIRDNLKKGENIIDATLDPLVGAELLLPNLFKENVSKITSNPTLQKILKVGKFGRALTPIGAGITAAGLGIDAAKFSRDRIRELQAMSPEQREELRSEGARQAFDPFMAAGGGIAKIAGVSSGPAPESGPNSQGLLSLKNRVRNY